MIQPIHRRIDALGGAALMPLLAPLTRSLACAPAPSVPGGEPSVAATCGRGSERRSASSLGPRMPRADLPFEQANL